MHESLRFDYPNNSNEGGGGCAGIFFMCVVLGLIAIALFILKSLE